MKLLNELRNVYHDVYSKGDYHCFDHNNKIKLNFRGLYYRFEQLSEIIDTGSNSQLFDLSKIYSESEADVTLTHHYNSKIKNDGFRLKAWDSLNVVIETGNLRGFRYAFEAFSQLFTTLEGTVHLLRAEVEHVPSFEMRGVIEGFYGTPWTTENRVDLVRFIGEQKMNTYMYAPKDDDYQRKLWRERYPEEKLADFKKILKEAEDQNVDFYYMISPGNDIDFTKESDIDTLCQKLNQLINIGVRSFGLLMDDIDYHLKGMAKIKFASAATAHAFLVNEVYDYLKKQIEDCSFVICPTEYDNRHGSPYLSQLTAKVHEDIPFFWTGPTTLAGEIRTEDIEAMAAIYNRPMIIWDNIPVNDFEDDYKKLFLSPYENRSKKMSHDSFKVTGVVSNPMPQVELSKFTILSMSQYLWDVGSFNTADKWVDVVESLVGKEYLADFMTIIDYSPNRHTRVVYNQQLINKIKENDIDHIDKEIKQLYSSSIKISTYSDKKILNEIKPWLEIIKVNYDLWQACKKEDMPLMKKLHKELVDAPVKIGTDFIMNYIEEHSLL